MTWWELRQGEQRLGAEVGVFLFQDMAALDGKTGLPQTNSTSRDGPQLLRMG